MWGVQGLRRTTSGMSFTKPYVNCLSCPRRGWEDAWCLMSARGGEVTLKGRNIVVVGSFLKGYTYHPHFECSVTKLSATLMNKWPLNSVFTASNPFYHIQWSLEGTSIKGRVFGHTRGRLGCKERGYIRRKKFYNEGTFLGREIEREKKK